MNLESILCIQNERDRRTLAWLRTQVGDEVIAAACEQLAGNRRCYLSNLMRVLNVTPPESLRRTPHDKALAKLAELKKMLR